MHYQGCENAQKNIMKFNKFAESFKIRLNWQFEV